MKEAWAKFIEMAKTCWYVQLLLSLIVIAVVYRVISWMYWEDAARVQAIGSIAAIIGSAAIAILVGWLDRRHDRIQKFEAKVEKNARIKLLIEVCRMELFLLNNSTGTGTVLTSDAISIIYRILRLQEHLNGVVMQMPGPFSVTLILTLMGKLEGVKRLLQLKTGDLSPYHAVQPNEHQVVQDALQFTSEMLRNIQGHINADEALGP